MGGPRAAFFFLTKIYRTCPKMLTLQTLGGGYHLLLLSLKMLLSLLLTLKLWDSNWEAEAGALETRYNCDNNICRKISSKRITSSSPSLLLYLSIYTVEKGHCCYRWNYRYFVGSSCQIDGGSEGYSVCSLPNIYRASLIKMYSYFQLL